MKTRLLFAGIGVLALGAGLLLILYSPSQPSRVGNNRTANATSASHDEASHQAPAFTASVPAYQDVSEVRNLAPTLPASNFAGKARDAYAVAKEIPDTLAQLPCYCHCDESFGHKSLHTCFIDDHAAHCAVCVDEALLAYRLEKSGKTAAQIREQIIVQYSTASD